MYQTILYGQDAGSVQEVDIATGNASVLFYGSAFYPAGLAVTQDASKFYYIGNPPVDPGYLMLFDGSTHIRVAQLNGTSNRLTIDANNNGYFTIGGSDTTELYTFDAANPAAGISLLGTITDAPGNTVSIATTRTSGDLTTSNDGIIFLLDAAANNMSQLFTINPASLEATYRAEIAGAGHPFGVALGENNILYSSCRSTIDGYTLHSVVIDPATTSWTAIPFGPKPATVLYPGDLADCTKAPNPFPPPIPLNNWAILLGILLIGTFIVIRYRRRLV